MTVGEHVKCSPTVICMLLMRNASEEDSATNSEAVEGRFTLLVSRNVVASELIHQARKGLESRLHLVHAFVPLTLLLGVGLL